MSTEKLDTEKNRAVKILDILAKGHQKISDAMAWTADRLRDAGEQELAEDFYRIAGEQHQISVNRINQSKGIDLNPVDT